MPPNNQQMPQPGQYGSYGTPNQPPMPVPQGGYPSKKSSKTPYIVIGLLVFLLIAALSFGVWAYSEMSKYKNESDKIVAKEVELAKQETSTQKDKEFLEKEKNPYKDYKSSDTLGAVSFNYPKTWSAYIVEDQKADSGTPIDGFLHPDFVPGKDSGTAYGLRVQELNRSYSELLNNYSSKVKTGRVKIQPYTAPKVPSVLGVKITGEIEEGLQSTMVILPLRDKALQIWTESPQYTGDFDNIIMSSLTFSP
jgi:hypothetical protein